ncbi:hypothetical protein TEU_03325 [Thermococcus eurythermalis]|uniref:Uncharacterized protein n=1 Tax=Thermococcus eurythermalis TaxID=1505907 RepID=A0A097QSI3_9EURY|nr:hypothetical protein [Thermococcus eurythermalis]AIU69455.1 hypothetical protein TEU_03325 [Thermococcus eurythermalis]
MKFVLRVSISEDNYVKLLELSNQTKLSVSDIFSIAVFEFPLDTIDKAYSKKRWGHSTAQSLSVSLSVLNKFNYLCERRSDLKKSDVADFVLDWFFKNIESFKKELELVKFIKF